MKTATSRNYIQTTEEQWDWIENKRPGLMKRLYDDFLKPFTDDATGLSLLSDIKGEDEEEDEILSKLIGESADNYSEKINAVFLNRFEHEQNTTTTEFGPYNPIYARLAATCTDGATSGSGFESASGFDSESRSEFDGEDAIMRGLKEKKKNPIAENKALQVMLAYNHFINESITWGKEKPSSFNMKFATTEIRTTIRVFEKAGLVFDRLFKVFKILKTGVTAEAVIGHKLPQGGVVDFGVLVSGSMTSEGLLQSVEEYAAIIELKRPNAGFGVAWKLLNGQEWTPEERSAFFKLKELRFSAFEHVKTHLIEPLQEKLHAWQKDSIAWTAAKEVLDKVENRRVEVKYSLSGDTEQHKQKLKSSYFVRTKDGGREDITPQLESAKFKDCFDICHEALADVAIYGALNNCTQVAIADGLTVIAGSLQKVEKSGDFYSSGSEDVFDVHLHDKAMIQTHDENSALYILEFLCEAAMSTNMLRGVGDELLGVVEDVFQGGGITKNGQFDVYERMLQRDKLELNPRDHSSKELTLVESSKLISVRVRGQVQQALASFDMHFPGIKSKASEFTSEIFAICEWFRENAFEGAEPYEPWYGRSKSVAKVMMRGNRDGKRYVLKEYFADEMSVLRMSHELEAYARISRLPSNERKHVAELVSFGSLDLDAGNPRLYLLLEYVEEYEPSEVDTAHEMEEVRKVADILKSVGVSHNDLEDRNYQWQCDFEGSWYIKVFDFDHATFSTVLKMEQ